MVFVGVQDLGFTVLFLTTEMVPFILGTPPAVQELMHEVVARVSVVHSAGSSPSPRPKVLGLRLFRIIVRLK